MRTFKVTFFDRYDILSVETFHNVTDQGAFIEKMAVNIVTLDIAPFVRCEDSDTGEDFTESVNTLLSYEIKDINPNYTREYLTDKTQIIL